MGAGVPLVAALALLASVAEVRVRGMDEDMAELAKMLRDTCVGETGVDVALLDAINKGTKLMNDDKVKCYIKCVMESAGMMLDGQIDVETVLALLPEDFKKRNEGNIRGCGTKKGTDDCDTAFQTHVCWQNANPPDYFLI